MREPAAPPRVTSYLSTRSSACSRPTHPASTYCRIESARGRGDRHPGNICACCPGGAGAPRAALGRGRQRWHNHDPASGAALSSRLRCGRFGRRAGRSNSAAMTTAASSSSGRVPPGRCGSSASREFGSRACCSSGRNTSRSAASRSHRWEMTLGCVSAARVMSTWTTCLVTAKGTPYRATLQIIESRHVAIRGSEFRHCGDRSPLFSNCLHLKHGTRHIRIIRNWFHDCRGCDFVHGLFGYDLTLRGNRFERALPCRTGRERCRHQDLVSFWSGNRLLVEGNSFGVYRRGAAQLYLIRGVDRVSIVNNVFRGTDPRVPGYRARVAIIVGSKGSKRVPRRVRIVNNTILTGARRDRRLRRLDPDERRLLGPPTPKATAPRQQRHRPRPGSASRLQRRRHERSETSCCAESPVEVRTRSVRRTSTRTAGRPRHRNCSSTAEAGASVFDETSKVASETRGPTSVHTSTAGGS